MPQRDSFRDPQTHCLLMVAEGTSAPDFTLPDETGAPVRLSALRGCRVVLWFYVRDDTPG